MPKFKFPKAYSFFILVTLVFLISIELSCKSQTNSENIYELHTKEKAIDLINSKISIFQGSERRGDTIYFSNPSKVNNHLSAALVIDSIVEYESNSKLLAVMRVFDTSNKTPFSNDSTIWQAVTDLGSGRGYQVTLALASISINEDNYNLEWLELDCGEYGEYFHLPKWTLHEFKDDDESFCWGAFIMQNHSTRMGFGHREIVVLDLGGPNHLEITLRHSALSEATLFSKSPSDDIALMEQELERIYNVKLSLEKHYEADLDLSVDGRKIIITETSKNWYADKLIIEGETTVIDTTTYNDPKSTQYEMKYWPAGYSLIN